MSGPDNPPTGGLGEASWAFDVKLLDEVPNVVPDGVGEV